MTTQTLFYAIPAALILFTVGYFIGTAVMARIGRAR